MKTLYWLVILAIAILAVYRIVKRDFYNFAVYAAIGCVIPLCLFHLDWSTLFLRHIASDFYLIIIYFGITVLVVSCIEKKNVFWNISFSIRSQGVIFFYNIVFFFLSLLENYMLSGTPFPFLSGIDVHTERIGGILWFTNTGFIVVALDYLAFYKTRKYVYLFLMLVGLFFPVIGKGSRIEAGIALSQLGLLILYIRKNKRNNTASYLIKHFFQNTIKLVAIIIVGILMISGALLTGELRSKGEVSSESQYALSIGYSGIGEGTTKDMLAWYYGYFPFSYHNLNNNIISTRISTNWIGFNSFKALWFGLLRFSWFGYESDIANKAKDITTTSATVVTAFWDFYYDYGSYCFIPIIIMGCFYLLLKSNICTPKVTIASILIYCYWAGLCFFISFNNVVFFDCVFINLIILTITSNLAFQVEYPVDQKEA